MANSNRVEKNASGQIMVPMNLEGSGYEENFLSSGKIAVLAILAVMCIVCGVQIHAMASWVSKLVCSLMLFLVVQFIFRKLVLQENYYAKIYKKSRRYNVTTPDVFWNIPNIQDTYNGAVILYGDGKTSVIVRAERDTITGKTDEFMEFHYDAVSDFYKAVNMHRLCLCQMNIMEPAGKDPRISALDSLIIAPSNKNLSKLMEMQIGHIRKMTRETLYETEYYILYSNEGLSADKMLQAVSECAVNLLNGAYVGYTILDRKEAVELMKEEFGVQYFDYGKATVNVFRNSGIAVNKAISIVGVKYADGSEEEIDHTGNIRINNLASYVEKGDLKPGEWTVKDALEGKIKNRNNVKVSAKHQGSKVQAGTAPEEQRDIYLNLDSDEFSEYIAPPEPEVSAINLDGQEKGIKRKGRKVQKDKGSKPSSKKKLGWKKGDPEVEHGDEIVPGVEDNFQLQTELDGDSIRVPTDDNEVIDL